MKKAIITGATGVIGITLINKLISEKIKVLVLVRKESSRINRIPKSEYVEIKYIGLSDMHDESVKIHTDKYDVFFHLAWDGTFGNARNDIEAQQKNVTYSLDAVKLAHSFGCTTFIGAGSQAEYGRVDGLLKPDTPCNPENGYGIAKLEASSKTRDLCDSLSIKHIWTRILSIYGPYDGDNTMVTSTITKLLNNETPSFSKAEQLWDYLYSDDAANALYLLALSGKDKSIYPVGSGVATPLYKYIYTIRDIVNPSCKVNIGALEYRENQVMHLCADISTLKKDTGFSPRIDFETGISLTKDFLIKSS